ncbi:nicotinamide riboside transporter PnuC [Alteromonas sp. a30]|uniref:nicotinamide riboside transporter PnuC n=1 Tax=Alteromonas sp. a30 TaxID=2730917 RepID=UPI00227FDB53|nr:nicotinamide riboside transporter PnuC [Alteromonas sp. a30]MCY7296659.1 nicotinamide mononucleotide transporter [Alteromonas sp. a30]
MDSIISEVSALSLLEMIAAILAFAYVWLAAKQNMLCWPCALFSSSIYTWVFWESALPHQSWLNIYYVLMALYGWLSWRKIAANQSVSSVKTLSIKWHLLSIVILLFATHLFVQLGDGTTHISTQYLDAGVAVFSVFTTFLVTQKVIENWGYWIVINSIATYLYASQGLYFTTILFIGYFFMAIYGLKNWQQQSRIETGSMTT